MAVSTANFTVGQDPPLVKLPVHTGYCPQRLLRVGERSMFPFHLLAALALATGGLFFAQSDIRESALPKAIPVTIQEGSAEMEYIVALQDGNDVEELLASLDIPLEHALVSPDKETPLTAGLTVTIVRERRISIIDGSAEPRERVTYARTVGDAVTEIGLVLGPLDRLIPDPAFPVRDETVIRILRIREEERREMVAIPFPVTATEDSDLAFGQERVLSEGRPGRAEELVRIVSENGRTVRRTILTRTVVEEPTPERRSRGTRIVIGRTLEGAASWYRYRGGDFAASTIFPRGTFLRITNLLNGRTVIVRVNDYGPTAPGRVIDLDAVAFGKLAPLSVGLIPTRVEEFR